jgi:hypothetical protein
MLKRAAVVADRRQAAHLLLLYVYPTRESTHVLPMQKKQHFIGSSQCGISAYNLLLLVV